MAMHQCKQRMLLYSNQLLNIVRKKIAIKANMVQEYGKNISTHAETKLKENMLWTQWVNFHLLCEQLIFQKKYI